MMIDRAYDADPGSGFGLKDRLVDRAAQFGATPEEVRAMREPMLVRVVPDAELARPGFTKTDAIRDFNVPGTAALTPAEQAIADARRVSQPTLDHIAERMEAKGPDATLAQVLEGRDGVEILNKLMADGAIARGDLAGLTTENALTAAGRARISQAMLGRYFRDPEQLDNIALSVKSKMERLAAPLASLEREGDYSLTPHVRSAMELLEAQRAHGSATVDDYLNQSSMFARERYSPEAQELARKLQTANPNDLVAAVRHYAAEAKYAGAYQGPGMFDDPLNRLPEPVTPRAAFNDAFGTKLPANGEAPAPEPPPVPKPSAAFADAFKPAPAAPPTPTAPPLGAKVGKFAGPEARAALDAGRAATAQKYDVASVLKSLPKSGDEGRQVFEQAFWQKDAGIEQLRRVAAAAPAEIPKLARAWIDDAVHTATQEGGFTRGAKLQRDWQNLGPETKALLFHPRMVADLDNFFRLAARQAANPNPSGSGVYTLSVAHAGWAIMHPVTGVPVVLAEGAVSRLMHSPAGIKALTDGLTVNVANKAAASLAAARILELAGQAVKTPQARLAAQAPRPQSGQRELLASR
jgi:hypothetical protein